MAYGKRVPWRGTLPLETRPDVASEIAACRLAPSECLAKYTRLLAGTLRLKRQRRF